jgi:glutathione peroxidase
MTVRDIPRAVAVAAAMWALGCDSKTAATQPVAPSAAPASSTTAKDGAGVHSLTAKRLDGTEQSLSAWAGKVVLIVNTASQCGYTGQYKGLEELHAKYGARGFVVAGFPSNDFGGQEPGSSEEIATFCKSKYGVTFPMFEKVSIKGSSPAPIFAVLAEAKGAPKWNFHKYLVDKKGRSVEAWPSSVEPSSAEIAAAIERELARP